MVEESKNRVVKAGELLIIELTHGKSAIVDDNEHSRSILKHFKFAAIAGVANNFHAVSISVREGRNYLHRLLLGLDSGTQRNVVHLDGNTLNCRLSNLQVKYNYVMLSDAKRLRNPLVGVQRLGDRGFLAKWFDSDGHRHQRFFSIAKYDGNARVTYEMAVEYRVSKAVQQLNKI